MAKDLDGAPSLGRDPNLPDQIEPKVVRELEAPAVGSSPEASSVPLNRSVEQAPLPAGLPCVSRDGGPSNLWDDEAFDDSIDPRLAMLISELADRMQNGESIDIMAECERYPEHANELKMLWGTLVVTDAVGYSDVSSFGDRSDSGSWNMTLPYRLGDYELIEEIGRGGMGVVFRAKQLSLNREVAVKMILKDRLASPIEKQRFLAEARATAMLDHPGIVPVYDVGDIDGRPYFVMKFVKGRTLHEQVDSSIITIHEAVRTVEQICRAVQYAHEHGIVHRDIKPSNILVDDFGHARLTDFGLAKHADGMDSLTRTGAVIGTPNYMSPEQASGRMGPIGPASDVYSLGSVLYFATTGRPPFQSAGPVDLLLKILEQDPPPPRSLNSLIDRDLEMITVRALQKPQDLRYRSAAAMGDDLQAYLRDEPISARSINWIQIVSRLFRDTHHAPVLENWGVLWMWHSLVVFFVCACTEFFQWAGATRWSYPMLWTVGLGAWAAVFWALRRRMGPVTFVERQIAHVWGASMIAIGLVFPIEWLLDLPALTLTPLISVICGMVFMVKAGILSGAFYWQAFALFASTFLMIALPIYSHLIFGVVAALCFFIPGLKYYRQSLVRNLH